MLKFCPTSTFIKKVKSSKPQNDDQVKFTWDEICKIITDLQNESCTEEELYNALCVFKEDAPGRENYISKKKFQMVMRTMGENLIFDDIEDFLSMMKTETLTTNNPNDPNEMDEFINIQESSNQIWSKLKELHEGLSAGKK